MDKLKTQFWIFNKWGVPHHYIFALAYVVLALPYLYVWLKMYKVYKNEINSFLDFCKLLLVTEISLFIYNLLLVGIGVILMQNHVNDSVFLISYVSYALIVFSFFLTVIITILYIGFRAITRLFQKNDEGKS
jgi:hypothetical protein